MGSLGRAHGYGMRFAEYMEIANDSVAVLVQAEHIDAVNCIESIVQIDGLDGIMLGPYDLSASMGKWARSDPEVTGAIDRIHQACQSAGIAIGYLASMRRRFGPTSRRGTISSSPGSTRCTSAVRPDKC